MEPLLKMLTSRQAETTSISQDSRDEAASLADVRVSGTDAGHQHWETDVAIGFHREC